MKTRQKAQHLKKLAVATLFALAGSASAIDTTWISPGGNWEDAGNWSHGVPNNDGIDEYNAFAQEGFININSPITINNLEIGGGAFLNLSVVDSNLTVQQTTTALSAPFFAPTFQVMASGVSSTLDLGVLAGFTNTLNGLSFSVSSYSGVDAIVQWTGADIQHIGSTARVTLEGANSFVRNSTDATDALTGLQSNKGSLQFSNRGFSSAGDFSNSGYLALYSWEANTTVSINGVMAQQVGQTLTAGTYGVHSSNGFASVLEWEGANIVEIAEGAYVQLDGADSVIRDSLTAADALAGLEIVAGTLEISDRDFTTTGNLSNSGALNVNSYNTSATLTISGTLTDVVGGVLTEGTLSANSSNTTGHLAALEWEGASIQSIGQNAAIYLSGTNSVIRNSLDATDALAGLAANAGSFAVNDRTFVTGSDFSNTGNLFVQGYDTATFTISGSLAQNSGGVLTAGSLSILAYGANPAILEWEGANIQAIGNTASVELQGAGSVIRNSLDSSDALALLDENAGYFRIIDRDFVTAGGFSNTGSLTVEGYNSTSTLTINGSLAENVGGVLTEGTINVSSGNGNSATIEWDGATIQTIGSDASVQFQGADSALRNTADASDALAGLASNEGRLSFYDRDFVTATDFSNTGNLSVTDSTFTISGTLAENTGGVLTAGNLSVSSYNGNSATIEWDGATIQTIGSDASVQLQGPDSSLRNTADASDALAGLASNEGWLSFYDRDFVTATDFSNTGNLFVGNSTFTVSGTLAENAGGVLTAGSLSVYSYNGNSGTIEWEGATIQTIGSGASVQLQGADSSIRNSVDASDALVELGANEGFFSLANREFATTGSFSNSGTLLITEDAAMLLGAGGDFANEGRLDIGGMGITTQAGGDMVLSATSVISFNLTIGPSGLVNFGALNIADTLSLDGDIAFSISLFTEGSAGDFISALDSFEVATAGSVIGNFANSLSGSRIFDIHGDSFLLTIHSGSIVFSDFSSVPEPGTAGLITLGLGSLLLRRRR